VRSGRPVGDEYSRSMNMGIMIMMMEMMMMVIEMMMM
jgi:hypothetical protein